MSPKASWSITFNGHKTELNIASMAVLSFKLFRPASRKNVNIKCLAYAWLRYTLLLDGCKVQNPVRGYIFWRRQRAFAQSEWPHYPSLSWSGMHFVPHLQWPDLWHILTTTQQPKKKKKRNPTPDNLLSERQQPQIEKSNRYPLVASSSSITVNFMQMLTRFYLQQPYSDSIHVEKMSDRSWIYSCTPAMDGLCFLYGREPLRWLLARVHTHTFSVYGGAGAVYQSKRG